MKRRTLIPVYGGVMLAAATLCASGQGSAPAVASPPQSPRAGTVFKNVQVLADISPGDFNSTMHFIRASLGTTCDHCHDVEHYEADVKPAKATARRMIQMVLDLNKNAFGGRTAVTCNTCHRGSSRPVAMPAPEQALFPDSTRGPVIAPKARPTSAQVLDRYIAAVGGRAALERLTSRAGEGTWSHMALGATPEGAPVAVNRGKTDPYLVATVGADGLTITRMGFDGTTAIADRAAGKTTITIQGDKGVAQTGATQQALSPISIASQMVNFALDRELKLAADAPTLTVADSVDVKGRAMHVLVRTWPGNVRERFYFDASDGLLRRRELIRPLLLGDDPVIVEYDDFRMVDGVRVPFTIKTSYLDDNHYGNTVQFTKITHNGR